MKKFICILLICVVAFASSISLAVLNSKHIDYTNEEIFKYILFEYNYLTKNDEEISRRYFENFKNNNINSKDTFIDEMNLPENTRDAIIYIQDNYETLVKEMTNKEKEIFDTFILKQALIYYYDVLGENYIHPSEEKIDNDKVNTLEKNMTRANNVATIRLYSDDSETTYGSSGLEVDVGVHAWISVTNLTDTPLTIGDLVVPSTGIVTIGTWENKSEHNGIWYNLEGAYYSYPSTTKHMTQLITMEQLQTLNTEIRKSSNDTWGYLNTCSSFASKMWNLNADFPVGAGLINTPKNLAQNMLNNGALTGTPVTTDLSVYYKGNNPVLSTMFN